MKNLPLLFLGIFFTLAFSWSGLILSSQIGLGRLEVTTSTLDEDGNMIPGDPLFPRNMPGLAQQGKRVYMNMGCMYCHSQQVRPEGFGSDFERGWGPRQSVPRDYILQERVMLGTMRTGPDLAHVGGRPLTRDWHLQHLYDPQITSQGSIMPPYPFLFEVRRMGDEPHPRAISVPATSRYAPPEGYEVIPSSRAEALVEYLLSLRIDYALPEIELNEG
jgi:cytochrome c oxidase cbb3-type subunit 2